MRGRSPDSRSKLVASAAIGLGVAQGCLGLSGTGPDEIGPGPDSGVVPSTDGGAKYGPDAPSEDAPAAATDAANAPDQGPAQTNGDSGGNATPEAAAPLPADAGDAGPEAGNPFSALVQLTIGDFNANTVSTTTMGGVALTATDGHTLPTDGNDFATQAEVTALGGTTGLPDNGAFAGNGTTIPPLQFGWNNATNNENALLAPSNATTNYSYAVPPGPGSGCFHALQIYATGTNGAQTVNYTLTYTTGAPTAATVTAPDWCATTAPPSGTSKLLSAERVHSAGAPALSDADGFLCSIYALNVTVDPSRVLSQFSFTVAGPLNSYLVLYGVAAW